jgi:group I intron endonuclease
MSTIGYYRITHRPTGYFYVGSSQNVSRRIQRHRAELEQGIHVNKNLQQIFTNWNDFSVETFPTETLDEARAGEQRLLDRHIGAVGCCNVSTSATNGFAGVRPYVPKETRIKNLEKATEARRGAALSEEHKSKLSHAHTGKVLSNEHRAALSKAKTGSSLSDSHREAIRQGNLGKTRTDEFKRGVGELKSRKVSINGVIYPSLKAASSAVGFSDVTVRKRLNDNVNYVEWFYLD